MITVNRFSCFCGFHSEGEGEAPACSMCGDKMRVWGTREVKMRSVVLTGESADKRTENGGYS